MGRGTFSCRNASIKLDCEQDSGPCFWLVIDGRIQPTVGGTIPRLLWVVWEASWGPASQGVPSKQFFLGLFLYSFLSSCSDFPQRLFVMKKFKSNTSFLPKLLSVSCFTLQQNNNQNNQRWTEEAFTTHEKSQSEHQGSRDRGIPASLSAELPVSARDRPCLKGLEKDTLGCPHSLHAYTRVPRGCPDLSQRSWGLRTGMQ